MKPFIQIKEHPNHNMAIEVKGRILTENKTISEVDNKIEGDQTNGFYIPVNKKYNVTLSDQEIGDYIVFIF